MDNRVKDNRAWLGVLPVLLIVAFSGVIPLMTVVNYSFQDILNFDNRFFVGFQWYSQTLNDPRFIEAFARQLLFTASILAIEIPLGIMVAKGMPRQGKKATAILLFLAVPLLIPSNVVGTIWQLFARSDIGLMGVSLNYLGWNFNYTASASQAWFTLLAMDIWHWTPFVTLTLLAGLSALPQDPYESAKIDGANNFQIFLYITIPMMVPVLIVVIFIRLMDSLKIVDEVWMLTGGGPGYATRFTGIHIWKEVFEKRYYGLGSAMSILYLYITIVICWILYSVMVSRGKSED